MPTTAPPSPAVGAIVAGRYRLDVLLGQGGAGAVWGAVDLGSGRSVAVKLLLEASARSTEPGRRLVREARAAAALQHPNVLPVECLIVSENEMPLLVMDRLEGETLRQCLDREGVLSVERVATTLLPVVSAVGAAHAVGIVHRDLKPENVFLDRRQRVEHVYVLDFGIAKLLESDPATDWSSGLTRTGTLLGTPFYMAPEQGFGAKDVDHRADIWSLGVILYECLSGSRPIEGHTLPQVLRNLTQVGIAPLASVAPGVPRTLAACTDRMLARDPPRRPSDLRAVRNELARYTSALAPDFGPPVKRAVAK